MCSYIARAWSPAALRWYLAAVRVKRNLRLRDLESGQVQLLTRLNLIVLGQKNFLLLLQLQKTHTGKLINECALCIRSFSYSFLGFVALSAAKM